MNEERQAASWDDPSIDFSHVPVGLATIVVSLPNCRGSRLRNWYRYDLAAGNLYYPDGQSSHSYPRNAIDMSFTRHDDFSHDMRVAAGL